MTAPPSNIADSDALQLSITSNGKAIASSWQLASVDVWLAVQQVPRARIEYLDPGDLSISNDDPFLPGTRISIHAGSGASLQEIFAGIVVRHGLAIAQGQTPRVVIDLASEAISMTLARRSLLYQNSSDATILGELIAAHGFTSEIAPTPIVLETIVQGYATDWDTLITRAEANGLLVVVEGSRITVKAPDTTARPVLTLTHGESILDLALHLAAPSQPGADAARNVSWDSATQTVLQTPPATRNQLAKTRGSVRFAGTPVVRPGVMVKLAGVGARFSGPAFVSAVHHQICDGSWQTTATLGMDSAPVADKASGIHGLQIGIVSQVAPDPLEGFRVQVTLPLLADGANAEWARLATPYASAGGGMAFFPEIGDEVLIGFLNDDPRAPVVLASLYSQTRKPAYSPGPSNDIKAIVTRTGLQIRFDDQDKILTLRTPGNQTITLDDTASAITLADSHNNTVTLNANGIQLHSASDLQLVASGDLSLSAAGNLVLKSNENATLNATTVTLQAAGQFSAQGAATAELKAGSTLTLQGAMVLIN